MDLWIYADETSFKREKAAADTAGYGVLIAIAPIGPAVVDEALAELEAEPARHDPKWKKQDDRTLANKYFHAADDSQNAHSKFCTSIRKHIIGHFTYVFEDPAAVNALSLTDLQMEALRIALVELCFWPGRINLVMEQRDGLNVRAVEKLILDLYRDMATRVYDSHDYPVYCPKVNVQIGNKKDASLQVVDFLLWSCARAHSNRKDATWLTRSGPTIKFEAKQGSGRVSEGSLHLGPNPLASLHPNYAPATHWIHEPPSATAWAEIEQTVRGWCANPPAEVHHLKPILDDAAAALVSTDFQKAPDHVKAIATAYLCVFDTIPLWKNATTNAEWTKLNSLRHAAAAVAKGQHAQLNVQMFVNNTVRSRRADIKVRKQATP